MLSKKNRLKNKALIPRIMQKGQVIRTPLGNFKYIPLDAEASQMAVMISKKVEPKATGRNKIRRRITEAMRSPLNTLESNVAGVFIAHKAIQDAPYSEIESVIKNIFQKI